MKNFIKPGRMMTCVAPSGGVTSGQPVLVDAMFGVAATAAAEGKEYELCTEGVFELTKATVDVVTVGEKLYWDPVAGNVTVVSTDNVAIGVAANAAGNGVTKVQVRLNGSF